MKTVESFRSTLSAKDLATVDCLRRIIMDCRDDLEETIKWNGPNFSVNGHDRITLGLDRKGGIRVVFHLGAKVAANKGFRFADTTGLAKWPAPDRGVAKFKDLEAVEGHRTALTDLCKRWLALTG